MLAATSGIVAICNSCTNNYRMLVYGVEELGVVELLIVPLQFALHTGPYLLRYFRLLVMYHPEMRGRWGSFLDESTMVKVLVAAYGVIELIIWPLSLVVGVGRCDA